MKEPRWSEEATQSYQDQVIIIRRTRVQWCALFFDAGLMVVEVVEGCHVNNFAIDDFYILQPFSQAQEQIYEQAANPNPFVGIKKTAASAMARKHYPTANVLGAQYTDELSELSKDPTQP